MGSIKREALATDTSEMPTQRALRIAATISFWCLAPLVFNIALVVLGLPVTLLGILGVVSENSTGWVQTALVLYSLLNVALSAVVVWMLWRRLRKGPPWVQVPGEITPPHAA